MLAIDRRPCNLDRVLVAVFVPCADADATLWLSAGCLFGLIVAEMSMQGLHARVILRHLKFLRLRFEGVQDIFRALIGSKVNAHVGQILQLALCNSCCELFTPTFVPAVFDTDEGSCTYEAKGSIFQFFLRFRFLRTTLHAPHMKRSRQMTGPQQNNSSVL